MNRFVFALSALLLAVTATAQDKLAGRWEGKIQSPQGERNTVVIFKRDGEKYTGRSAGLRPGMEMQIKDVMISGDDVTAKADVETPQGALTVNYKFKLAGEAMKGQGALDFGGQAITFDLDLKRVSPNTDGPLTTANAGNAPNQNRGGQGRPRADIQPQQKQSLDYFVGTWEFKYIGRDSALAPAPRDGIVTFTKAADGKLLNAVIEGKTDAGAYKDTATVTFDETTKTLLFAEKLANGTKLNSKGDWSSPIAIRFTIDPVKVKGQALQLRRQISIVAAHSFTVTEEIAENGGSFVRLGAAVYSRKK
ncbi:MAG: hypothetical protein U0Y68_00360 [Blastocatellia bacterium]